MPTLKKWTYTTLDFNFFFQTFSSFLLCCILHIGVTALLSTARQPPRPAKGTAPRSGRPRRLDFYNFSKLCTLLHPAHRGLPAEVVKATQPAFVNTKLVSLPESSAHSQSLSRGAQATWGHGLTFPLAPASTSTGAGSLRPPSIRPWAESNRRTQPAPHLSSQEVENHQHGRL